MSKFTKKICKVFQFDGDSVEITLDRLKRKDALKILPTLGDPDENGSFSITFSKQIDMLEQFGDIVHKYISSVVGLKDSDGSAYSSEEAKNLIMEEAYFMNLLSDIIKTLFDESFLKENDIKKSVDTSEEE